MAAAPKQRQRGWNWGPPPAPRLAWPGTGKTNGFALKNEDTRLVYNWTQTGPSSQLTQYASMLYYLTKVVPQYLFEFTRYKFKNNYFIAGNGAFVRTNNWHEKNPRWRIAFAAMFENETDLQGLLLDQTKKITEGRFEISSFANLCKKRFLGTFNNPSTYYNSMYYGGQVNPFREALFKLKEIRNKLVHNTRDFMFHQEFAGFPTDIAVCVSDLMTEFKKVPPNGVPTFNAAIPGIVADFDNETNAAFALMTK